YARQWVEHRNVKPRTRIGYEAILDGKLGVLGDVPLTAVTPHAIRAWHAGLDKDKPTARAHAYQFLHAVMATAVTDGLLPSNPCNIPKAMSTNAKRQAVILTPDQLAALADAIEPKRLRMLV